MDSKARIFPEKLKKFIAVRDRHCRTPFCDGIVEEIDHVKQYARGGKTTVSNGDGRCAACNKAKQAAGWYEYTTYGNGHSITICPGSAMSYKSTAPPSHRVRAQAVPATDARRHVAAKTQRTAETA